MCPTVLHGLGPQNRHNSRAVLRRDTCDPQVPRRKKGGHVQPCKVAVPYQAGVGTADSLGISFPPLGKAQEGMKGKRFSCSC